MAFMTVEFFSKVLHMAVAADVIIPQAVTKEIGQESREVSEGKHPVLYLLHGATDDYTTWQRRTSIERYATKLGLAVVMPSGHLSSYSNMKHGGAFYDYISQELPEVMCQFFNLSDKREDTFIAGNSMGGYGAMKIGVANPERYSVIGCFSAGAENGKPHGNAGGLFTEEEYRMRNEMLYGGENMEKTYQDTYHMAKKNQNLPNLPRIFHTCGSEDFLINQAHEMRDFFMGMENNPYQYVYEEYPGVHGWEYWDEHVQRFLDFLNLSSDLKFQN
jgi:S-formylglutathione hydrolase FrmB